MTDVDDLYDSAYDRDYEGRTEPDYQDWDCEDTGVNVKTGDRCRPRGREIRRERHREWQRRDRQSRPGYWDRERRRLFGDRTPAGGWDESPF